MFSPIAVQGMRGLFLACAILPAAAVPAVEFMAPRQLPPLPVALADRTPNAYAPDPTGYLLVETAPVPVDQYTAYAHFYRIGLDQGYAEAGSVMLPIYSGFNMHSVVTEIGCATDGTGQARSYHSESDFSYSHRGYQFHWLLIGTTGTYGDTATYEGHGEWSYFVTRSTMGRDELGRGVFAIRQTNSGTSSGWTTGYSAPGLYRSYHGANLRGALTLTTASEPVLYNCESNLLTRNVMTSTTLESSAVWTFPTPSERFAFGASETTASWQALYAVPATGAIRCWRRSAGGDTDTLIATEAGLPTDIDERPSFLDARGVLHAFLLSGSFLRIAEVMPDGTTAWFNPMPAAGMAHLREFRWSFDDPGCPLVALIGAATPTSLETILACLAWENGAWAVKVLATAPAGVYHSRCAVGNSLTAGTSLTYTRNDTATTAPPTHWIYPGRELTTRAGGEWWLYE